LESQLQSEFVIVHLPDGSIRKVCGRHENYRRLLAAALGSLDLTPSQAADLELIRRAITIQQPDGGCMFELLHALLNSPD
jgi:hypothetical protein